MIYFTFSLVKRETQVRRERKSMRKSGQYFFTINGHQPTISTGSMYLRCGCVGASFLLLDLAAFGMMGVIYYILIFLVCTMGWEGKERDCNAFNQAIAILASVFIFAQMWFVFCNGKVGSSFKELFFRLPCVEKKTLHDLV